MMQTTVWDIPEEYELAETVPFAWCPRRKRQKLPTPDFARLDRGPQGGMLCNISALPFKTLQPHLIQNLQSPVLTALKKNAPAFGRGVR
jgi:hypothetical protein